MAAEPLSILRSRAGHRIPLAAVNLAGTAEGCLFEMTVEQRYTNGEDETIEAIYTFPLPTSAVLLSFELEIGERRLAGVVRPKTEASNTYEHAVGSGDTAALLEQASDGLYTVSIGNLKANERAVVRYRYAQLVNLEQGRIRLAVPMAVAPRYGHPAGSLAPHQAPFVDLVAQYPCHFALTLRGELARARVSSPTHGLRAIASDGELRLVAPSPLSLDRDFIVLIDGLATPPGIVARDGEGYVALASIAVPRADPSATSPTTLKLVLDCSGSMAGTSIEQARDAVPRILASLDAADFFSLTRFGSSIRHETDGVEKVTPALVADLTLRVHGMNADLGGTEMAAALASVLELPVRRETPADVLLITDGEIWAIDALVRRLADSRHRLFVLAIGASPVEELARRIAEVTRGACEFVTPGEDMGAAVARLLTRIRAPRLAIESVDWPQTPTWSVGRDQAVFAGDTVHLFGGFDAAPAGSVAVRLGGNDARPLTCQLPTTHEPGSALARVAAMRRLSGLEPTEAAALAERYALVTKHTSCVVVLVRADGEKADGDPKLRVVPQMLAAGWGGTGNLLRATRSPRLPGTIPPEAAPAFYQRSSNTEPSSCELPDAGISAGRHPGLRRDDNGRLVNALPQASIASRLAERLVERHEPMPATVEELRTLGVPEEILERLRETIAEGNAERDVVVAWLAIFAWSRAGTTLGVRLKARLALAADETLRTRISRRLPDIRLQ